MRREICVSKLPPRGVCGEASFKIDWASLIVGRKFTVFSLFYFVFEGNFPSTSPREAWRGDLTEGFWRYRFEGLVFGGALYIRNSAIYQNLEDRRMTSRDSGFLCFLSNMARGFENICEIFLN